MDVLCFLLILPPTGDGQCWAFYSHMPRDGFHLFGLDLLFPSSQVVAAASSFICYKRRLLALKELNLQLWLLHKLIFSLTRDTTLCPAPVWKQRGHMWSSCSCMCWMCFFTFVFTLQHPWNLHRRTTVCCLITCTNDILNKPVSE